MSGERPDEQVQSIRVDVGQEFRIALPANASTGYCWELAEPLDTSVVELLAQEYRAPTTGTPGAPGESVWIFRAASAGRTTITLAYARPWDQAPAEQTVLSVHVG